jgi:hypothetical protein
LQSNKQKQKTNMTLLFKKLNYKAQTNILAINSPESFEIELNEMAKLAAIYKTEKELEKVDFAIVFVMTQDQINEAISLLFPKLVGDAVLWFCYPKGTSKKYKCDFNRDTGWAELGKYNLEGVRQVALDADWSALRFRKTAYIKTLTRSQDYAISEEGKKRVAKNGK